MHTASPEDVRFAWEYLRLTEAEGPNWGMMCGALQSPGDTVILTMQDLLGLGSAATPAGLRAAARLAQTGGRPDCDGVLRLIVADRLHHVTGLYRRLPR